MEKCLALLLKETPHLRLLPLVHLGLATLFGISLAQLPCETLAFRFYVPKFLVRFVQALVEKSILVDKATVGLRHLLNLVHQLGILLFDASANMPRCDIVTGAAARPSSSLHRLARERTKSGRSRATRNHG